MKTKALIPVIIIGIVLAFAYHFIAIAAIDAPHNESSSISCGSCHGEGLLQSFWGGSGLYSTVDELCLSCHKVYSGPFVSTNAPVVVTHLDSDEIALAECINCHDPHYQKQKLYKNEHASELYLATGELSLPCGGLCFYNSVSNTTLVRYLSITYKPGWDASRLLEKTGEYRRAIFFPNVRKLGYSYPIVSINPTWNQIIVKGNAVEYLSLLSAPTTFAVIYGQYVRDVIDEEDVKLFDQVNAGSFADGEGDFDGVCEVCHTATSHFRNNGAAPDQHHENLGNGIPGVNCIGCHSHTDGFLESGECIDCHSISLNGRAAVTYQFKANSHHVQDVPLMNMHCYECHWEANADGSINNDYHDGYNTDTKAGIPGEKVDLVIYGAGTRPDTYTEDETVIQYMADGSREEFVQLNDHCISCHSDQNNATVPFGDGKTPRHYAWDNTSIDARYSQTGSTTWGKYTDVANAAKKDISKAFSAHGMTYLNDGGWSQSTGVDGSIPNSRGGTVNLACFDCHNSHGSRVTGPTSSYTSATANGGILKDIEEGIGGFSMSYKPQAGGSAANNNAYSAGASLCFDCHLTENAGTTPWGYKETFHAAQPVMGYWDSPYFGPVDPGNAPISFAPEQRFGIKRFQSRMAGHFGASSSMGWGTTTGTINGLCTPCHDPHGVSPTINQEYAVPLLKGTWLTSPYKEDRPPLRETRGLYRKVKNEVHYHIDQNTFSDDIIDDSITGITEDDSQFSGLCFNCHPKDALMSCGWGGCTWQSTGKTHQSVKGWDDGENTKHRYTCSKCHVVHNADLPRLMATSCLERKHKGVRGNQSYIASRFQGQGSGDCVDMSRPEEVVCTGSGVSVGFCPEGRYQPYKSIGRFWGEGRGSSPGSWNGGPNDNGYFDHSVTCHEGQSWDQSWNDVTPWAQDDSDPEILEGPVASPPVFMSSTFQTTITWSTRNSLTSDVYFGFTNSYGSLVSDVSMVKNHSTTLTDLENHKAYHFKVHSTDNDTIDINSDDYTFYTNVPPSVPTGLSKSGSTCTGPCPVTVSWNASTDPDGGPVQYFVELYNEDRTSIYTSDWIADTEWTKTVPLDYWYARVMARDGGHPEAVSVWTDSTSFNVVTPPSAPVLVPEPDFVSPGSTTVSLEWLDSSSATGNNVEYQVWIFDSTFSMQVTSDWTSDTYWSVVLEPEKTYHWQVRARDVVYTEAISGWSTLDSFNIKTSNPPPAPDLTDEPDIVTSVPVDITLEWEDVDDPEGDPVEYQVWVSESTLFSPREDSGWMTEAAANCDGSTCNWTVTIDTASTWYWKVQARDVNNNKISAWSALDTFRVMTSNPPPTPTLTPEPDIVSSVAEDVTLEWNQVSDPNGDPVEYYVEISAFSTFWAWQTTSSGWLSEAAASCDGSTCSWTTNVNPVTYKTWYWRVKARDANNTDAESVWSEVDSFQFFSSNAPPAPTLTDEPDTFTTVPVDVTLEWEDVDDPDGDPVEYEVLVTRSGYHDSGWLSETDANCDGSVCNWTVTVANGKTWEWKVQARDADHTDAISAWSNIDIFNTFSSNPPPTPELTDEPDIETSVPVDVTLEWEDVDDPDGDPVQYNVQIDDVALFTTVDYESGWLSEAAAFCDGSTCSWTVTISQAKTWHWRVGARDADHIDAMSSYSASDSFAITDPSAVPENPSAPSLINEPNYISSDPLDITFEWIPVTCPDGDPVKYLVEVNDTLDFSNPITSGLLDEATYCVSYRCSWTVNLATNTTWYWRVNAHDAVHTDKISVWSGIDSFILSMTDPPPVPTLTNVLDSVSHVAKNITFEWDQGTCPDGDPVEYYVELDDAPDFVDATTSGWLSETDASCDGSKCSWSYTCDPDITWNWRVKSRDSVHTILESAWSVVDPFFIHLPIIYESFEQNIILDGTGYDDSPWTETIDTVACPNCELDPDTAIPGITPPDGSGFECLKSVSADPEYRAFTTIDYGSVQRKTFTRMYLYVEDIDLVESSGKYIAAFQDGSDNYVFTVRLYLLSGQLFFNLRLYNNGAYQDYGNSAVVSLDTWHWIDIKYDDFNNTWEWKFDGAVQDSGSLTGTHYTGIQKWFLGFADMTQQRAGTIYFDLLNVNTFSYLD